METTLEEYTNEALQVILRPNDNFESRYNNNTDNNLKASDLKRILSEERFCFFQKQKGNQEKDIYKHKIIVPLGNDRAIEVIGSLRIDKVSMFSELYSYQISKINEVNFLTEPVKNTVKKKCSFKFVPNDEKAGTEAKIFQVLFEKIEACEIPTVDINKATDVRIWANYVSALKKLVKDKEQVWKIENISSPYTEFRDGDNERSSYIDLFIDEKDLVKKLQKGFFSLFKKQEIEDHGIDAQKAFIEFKNYTELGNDQLTKLKALGEELFYEVSNASPRHMLSGKIEIVYADNASKDEIFLEIENKLKNEYQLDYTIAGDGKIIIQEKDVPHLEKLIFNYFDQILVLEKDTNMNLEVQFPSAGISENLIASIKAKLDSQRLDRAKVYSTADNHLIIEVSSFLHKQAFIQENLSMTEVKTRFQSPSLQKIELPDGIIQVGNIFEVINADRQTVERVEKALKEKFNGKKIKRLPTQYVFTEDKATSLDVLRDFKTQTDLKEKSVFSINTSSLKITAENEDDFENEIRRIKYLFPNAVLEERKYSPTYFLKFHLDLDSKRENIFSSIRNDIFKSVNKAVDFDLVKKSTVALFSYEFQLPEERDFFKEEVKKICSKYEGVVNFSFDNSLGRSTYELIKDETLEIEKEKEVRRNISQATFIYLTPVQKDKLDKEKIKHGVDATFKEGVTIGRLIRKEKNKLKFKITDIFDEMINGREKDRITLEELQKGFIKPIFPGELTNVGRMIRAMKKVTEPSVKNGFPVNRNLSNFLFDPNEARQSSSNLENEKEIVAANLNEPLLSTQPKQLEAVAKTLIAPDLAIIQGPPGTGKTTVIAEIIWQTLIRESRSKLLITSQTNLAVDNALERIKGKKLVRPLRIGNVDKFEDEGKVYSNERIKNWMNAEEGSSEEKNNSDNAVSTWVDSIISNCSTDIAFSKGISKWKEGLMRKDRTLKKVFGEGYLKNVNVFAATCSECGSRNFSDAFQATFPKHTEGVNEPIFDLVIMDEASKATPPELVMPLTLGKKVVIIGDHKQLPPMIDEKEFGEALELVGAKKLIEGWTNDDYKISQFEKLFKNAPKNFVTSLDTQFRMHDQIMNCISQFYTDQEELENGLVCGIKDVMDIPDLSVKASRWHGLTHSPFIEPRQHAIWVNVDSPEDRVGTSYENNGEIAAIKNVLNALVNSQGFDDYSDSFSKDEEKEIGIITFYMPQMLAIKKALYPTFSKNEWRNFEQFKFNNQYQIPFRINTVDRFQGMERNIIIISTVRSSKQYKVDKGKKIPVDNNKYPYALGFAKELQRINVGFSRAKRLLIVIGNEKHFSNKPEYEKAIKKMHRIDISQINNLI